jgi:hypothetical protein
MARESASCPPAVVLLAVRSVNLCVSLIEFDCFVLYGVRLYFLYLMSFMLPKSISTLLLCVFVTSIS